MPVSNLLLPAWGIDDQISKETPLALQASAMFFPCVTSISLDMYSQSLVEGISQCNLTSLVFAWTIDSQLVTAKTA